MTKLCFLYGIYGYYGKFLGLLMRKLELTQPVVILCQCTLTLKELDEDSRLIIGHGEECPTFVHSRDGSVSGNKFSEDITSGGLNTKCKQADINENNIQLCSLFLSQLSMTPDQPFTILSNCVHTFTTCSIVCTYVS